jgi:hypothetical protein
MQRVLLQLALFPGLCNAQGATPSPSAAVGPPGTYAYYTFANTVGAADAVTIKHVWEVLPTAQVSRRTHSGSNLDEMCDRDLQFASLNLLPICLQEGPDGNAVFAALQFQYQAGGGVTAYMGTQAFYDSGTGLMAYRAIFACWDASASVQTSYTTVPPCKQCRINRVNMTILYIVQTQRATRRASGLAARARARTATSPWRCTRAWSTQLACTTLAASP